MYAHIKKTLQYVQVSIVIWRSKKIIAQDEDFMTKLFLPETHRHDSFQPFLNHKWHECSLTLHNTMLNLIRREDYNTRECGCVLLLALIKNGVITQLLLSMYEQ